MLPIRLMYLDNFYLASNFNFIASGRKLTVPAKRTATNTIGKSQTLPRMMGSRTPPVQSVRPFTKPTSTPPMVKRQLSGPSSSPIRKGSTPATGGRSSSVNARVRSASLRGVDSKLAQNILDEIIEGKCSNCKYY